MPLLLAFAIIGDATQIEMILFVSRHLKWPRQVGVGLIEEQYDRHF
jgi:hypothetical protein